MSPFAATLLATWLTAAPTDDLEAIRARVADYTEGVKSGDAARLQRAFHTEAKLLHVEPDGRLDIRPSSDFIQSAVQAPVPESEASVLQVDLHGSAAIVKVAMRTRRWSFIDYLTLLKVEGQWTIVNKAYHRAPRTNEDQRGAGP
ncbi:hypothetical protein A176_004847 [Myxococcus hansupus]|uniref:Nuclear transport factor 2 family protein n=1 Tax=Pseudomyxococcus hansupus TaxID=1297742 RepID=A0A0H4X2R1_9BACT|nr:nuclear transport factor 2 family protein [Myxococcus hansupus]AKQ67935.1 hypothetical protein A176_004847 [Myxococcus hansupus]